MDARRIAVIAALAIVAGACTPGAERAAPEEALITELPRVCGSFEPGGEAAVTFSADGHLYAAAPDGGEVRCLAEGVTGPLVWGAAADRLLAGDAVLLASGSGDPVPAGAASANWSRPTGRALVWVEEGRLWKRPAGGGSAEDISFLARHDEVTYHPAGTHIAIVGEDAGGRYGIFLATNLGTDARLLAEGETARGIGELTFDRWGSSLFFVADHGDVHHVHELAVVHEADADRETLEILHESSEELASLVVAPFDTRHITFRDGPCAGASTTRRIFRGRTFDVGDAFAGRSTVPVGWVPAPKVGQDAEDAALLMLLVRERGCEGPGDLYLWSTAEDSATLLVRGVDAATAAHASTDVPPPPEPVDRRVVA